MTPEQALAAYNALWTKDKVQSLALKDFAGPNQSFPITNQEDVNLAALIFNTVADPETLRKSIIHIATEKKLNIPQELTVNDKRCEGCGRMGSLCNCTPAHNDGNTPMTDDTVIRNNRSLFQKFMSLFSSTPVVEDVVANGGPGSGPRPHGGSMTHKQLIKHAEQSTTTAMTTGTSETHLAAQAAHTNVVHSHLGLGNTEEASKHMMIAHGHGEMAKSLKKSKKGGTMNREQALQTLTANCKNEKDKQVFATFSDETLISLAQNAVDPPVVVNPPKVDKDGNPIVPPKPPVQPPIQTPAGTLPPSATPNPNEPAPQPRKPDMTDNEYLAAAPPRLRAIFENAIAVENNEKTKIVNRLIANAATKTQMTDAVKKTIIDRYMGKSLAELQELMMFLPPVNNSYIDTTVTQQDQQFPIYLGSAGGDFTSNQGYTSESEADVLMLPVMNYSEEVA